MTSFILIRYGSIATKSIQQNSVIRFWWANEFSSNAIQSEMRPVYDDKCFTRPAIHVWCKKFAHGRERIVDEERPVHMFRQLTQRSQRSTT